MDRKYGYIYIGSDGRPYHTGKMIFPDMILTIKDAMSQNFSYPDCCPVELKYFKVLNNKRIVAELHNQWTQKNVENEQFGFCIMKLEAGQYVPCIYSEMFYSNISQCISYVMENNFDLPETSSIKIAYFKFLETDDLVKEIHNLWQKKIDSENLCY